MRKGQTVIYIDGLGKQHEALVTAINPMHEGVISMIYVDEKAAERENVKQVFDVVHVSHPSRQEVREVPFSDQANWRGKTVLEGNLALPTFHVNCWMKVGDSVDVTPIPADHPQFDTKYSAPKPDEHGRFIEKPRPKYEAVVEQFQNPQPAQEGQTEYEQTVNQELIALQETNTLLNEQLAQAKAEIAAFHGLPSAGDLDATVETKHYSDGSSATGIAPLPDLSPGQQAQRDAAPEPDVTAQLDAAGPAPEEAAPAAE